MSDTLTPQELASRWKIDHGTLDNWRQEKKGPAYIKLGSGKTARIRYRIKDIETYEKHFRVNDR